MERKKPLFSNFRTLIFVVIICASCALVLSILAEFLKMPQKNAKELYRSKQLLLAARILGYEGHFLLDGVPASYDAQKNQLVPTNNSRPPKATSEEILSLFETRVITRLTDKTGKVYTFQEVNLDEQEYLTIHAKLGYAQLPYKLIYLVKENEPSSIPYGYVLPVNGYGLWDAIYGYLGLKANGDTILGMTWYDQKETPGLGGEIALPEWQGQFFDKVIFQKNPAGTTNFERTSLGIKIVKTTVAETYGDSPISDSAVDGIPGASITVSGVNDALRTSLAPYRPFLIRAHNGEVKIDE
ncbi:MAG: NADH:ubiquinone reductase (Na(+)-transporting) subunit C [Simkaniaceae bacterium]|nr:MAG: NADH:ubiquinone reductase (Na(+)-transporting) subunit C [Simkaniaceae bacterium]